MPGERRSSSGSWSGATGRSLITESSSRPCTRRARTMTPALLSVSSGVSKKHTSRIWASSGSSPSACDRRALRVVRHGQLQLDAVGAGGEGEQLLEIGVADGQRGPPAGCSRGRRHAVTVSGRWVTAPHPRWVGGPSAGGTACAKIADAMSAHDAVARRLHAPRSFAREWLTFPLAVLALAAAYYGAAELVFCARGRRPRGSGRVAARSASASPRSTSAAPAVARRPHRRPAGERLRRAAGRDLRCSRPPATWREILDRAAAPPPPGPQGTAAGQHRRRDGDARGARRRRDRQRDDRHARAARRRRDRRGRDRHGLAHVVARRLHRGARDRAARHRLVAAAARMAVARARPRGRRCCSSRSSCSARSPPAPRTRCCTSCSRR